MATLSYAIKTLKAISVDPYAASGLFLIIHAAVDSEVEGMFFK